LFISFINTVNINSTIDIFEVYKLGSKGLHELQQLPVNELRARYTLLKPITDKAELEKCTTLATLPNENRMVVDKNKFIIVMNEKIAKAVQDKKIELGRHTDEAIASLNLMTEETNRSVRYLKQLDAQRINKNDLIKQYLENKNNDDITKLRESILKILEDDEKEAEVLFNEAKTSLTSQEVNNAFTTKLKSLS